MAVNEKAVYAREHTSHAGILYKPGERLDGRMPEHALRGAEAGGLTTSSHAEAERAKNTEADRRQQVSQEILGRSEKRDHEKRVDRRG